MAYTTTPLVLLCSDLLSQVLVCTTDAVVAVTCPKPLLEDLISRITKNA